jgi:hypothetical protein
MNDKDLGLKILRSFYGSARYSYPFATNYSFDDMIAILHSRVGGKNIESGLGLAANLADFDDDKINTSMRALALSSGGKIPSKNGDFYAFMVNEATKVNFVDAIVYTTKESAKDVVNGAAKVGDSLLFTGQIVIWLLPIAVVYFGYVYLKNKTK